MFETAANMFETAGYAAKIANRLPRVHSSIKVALSVEFADV